MRNYRTPVLRLLRRSLLDQMGSAPDDGAATTVPAPLNRRSFLLQSSRVIAGVGLASTLGACGGEGGGRRTSPRVVILGAGLAGLSAGHALRKRGIPFQLFEATSRAGGRVFSVENGVADGSVAELGGEFIDSNHEDMLALAAEFELALVDLPDDMQRNALMKETYFIDGRHHSGDELVSEFANFASAIADDVLTLETDGEELFERYDAMSIPEYLRNKGAPAWVVTMLAAAYTGEYGLDAEEQSALNLLYMLDPDTSSGVRIFGDSDERYRIRGGNQRLVDRLTDTMREHIEFGHRCTAIRQQEATYVLSFQNGAVTNADYLIVTIPFTVLRSIDLDVELPDEKRRVIRELSYGTNSKLILGYASRPWRQQGYSGQLFNEQIHNGWDAGAADPDSVSGAYTVFLGGREGKALDDGMADEYARMLDAVFPGSHGQRVARQLVYNWSHSDMVLGSYSAYRKGQWSTIAGNEVTPVGNMFFAGEHCSEEFQGYMNGAAQTGRLAAEQVAARALKET